jgi:hypothetical protein
MGVQPRVLAAVGRAATTEERIEARAAAAEVLGTLRTALTQYSACQWRSRSIQNRALNDRGSPAAAHNLIGDRRVQRLVGPPPFDAAEYSPREVSNVDLFSDLNRQHVFGPLKRTGVCFPRLSDHASPLGPCE